MPGADPGPDGLGGLAGAHVQAPATADRVGEPVESPAPAGRVGEPPPDATAAAPIVVDALPVPARTALPVDGRPVVAGHARRGRSRAAVIVTVVVVLVVAAALLINTAARRGAGVPDRAPVRPAPSPAVASHPALRVAVRDAGTSLVATWLAPPDGPAPAVVALAGNGQPATVVASVPAGTLSYTITGIDPHAQYCVIVAAVYPGAVTSAATSVCTSRALPSR